jgi:hypothetical protein
MPSEGLNAASLPKQHEVPMHRRAGLAFGVALAFVAGISLAACGQADTSESSANSAPQAVEAVQTAQTTAATLPVVTVYKSPT